MANRLYWLLPLALLSACQNEPKYTQYYNEGQQLYEKHCSNCHQSEGTGLGLVYPPLVNADYMDAHADEVLCLIRYGRKGPLTVNGKEYNQPMPGVPLLTDLEVAEVATYIYNTFGHERGIQDVKEVGEQLKRCEK
ncbi:MAG: cytochrome c [Cyclobacteriaceae bacterium]|nr:cytochrome c [Cyclobacteriaceae bacterium]